MELSKQEIDNICEEIEIQWNYHLMTRAVFHSRFPEEDVYESPFYYHIFGYRFKVELPDTRSEKWLKTAQGVATWLNQNYVIRLYGILDSKGLRRIEPKPDIIKLVEKLRANVGAHSTGRNISKKCDHRQSIQLINSLFNQNFKAEKADSFILSIDTVLEPLKNQLISLIKQLDTY